MGYRQASEQHAHQVSRDEHHQSEPNIPHGQLVVLSSLTDTVLHLLEEFQHQLRLCMQSHEKKPVDGSSNIDEAIHTVELLFNVLLYDNHLPETVTVHIARMQTLYVKIAASDPGFYTQEEHPARCFLSHLVNEAKSPNYDAQLEQQILYMIEQVLENFAQNPAIFSQLLEQSKKKVVT